MIPCYTCLDHTGPADPARSSTLVHPRTAQRLFVTTTSTAIIQRQSYKANKSINTPTAINKDKKFIKRIYIALRSHRRKDHENQSYNEEVMIFRRFPLNK